MVSLLITS
jgi:2-oxoisovalerate dehydrogenase E2 component (dihydrolipoyl transacylase)